MTDLHKYVFSYDYDLFLSFVGACGQTLKLGITSEKFTGEMINLQNHLSLDFRKQINS